MVKNPSPLVAVNGDVFAVVHQSTVPVLPNPVCVAPLAKVTVQAPPNSNVLPDLFSILFTLIVLIIETYILILLHLNLQPEVPPLPPDPPPPPVFAVPDTPFVMLEPVR